MGNTTSTKDRHGEDSVDFGSLSPQGGIYTSTPDWNQTIVAQLIIHRKLAPFYRPLEDYEDDWDDEQILAAQKKQSNEDAHEDASASGGHPAATSPPLQSATSALRHAASGKSAIRSSTSGKEPQRNFEAQLYRGAVECPICFLYYPPNINQTRCCDQAICSECFVQIKRAEPTTTHVVSEPACCPYCMQSNFGVTYSPPPWRAGIGSDTSLSSRPDFLTHSSSNSATSIETGTTEGKRRRKSLSHTSQHVVTIDQIRPDWEVKLNAVRAAVARRANRRIIMRQVGDQLIPVGIARGSVVAIPQGADGNSGEESGTGNGSRRRRRDRNGNNDLNHFLGSMGMAGQDLEELMIMEAMRLSMVEENERQRRAREEEEQNGAAPSRGFTDTTPPNSSALQRNRVPPRTLDVPSGSSSLPTARSSISAHSRRSSHSTLPETSIIGGSSASLALAVGGSPAQAHPLHPQSSALSAMLGGAAITATAILGDRSSQDHGASPEREPVLIPDVANSNPLRNDDAAAQTPRLVERALESADSEGEDTASPAVITLSTPSPPITPRNLSTDNVADSMSPPAESFLPRRDPIPTPMTMNSEPAEEYDFLPSTPRSSVASEISARAPLIAADTDSEVDSVRDVARGEEALSSV